jgi:hypothetical protein
MRIEGKETGGRARVEITSHVRSLANGSLKSSPFQRNFYYPL